jgi:hypothetical protein
VQQRTELSIRRWGQDVWLLRWWNCEAKCWEEHAVAGPWGDCLKWMRDNLGQSSHPEETVELDRQGTSDR